MNNIAIKVKNTAHGKQVIKYLESLGAKNPLRFEGNAPGAFYFIDSDNKIYGKYDLNIAHYEIINLPEEFSSYNIF